MPSPLPVPPLVPPSPAVGADDMLAELERLEATMSGPAASELEPALEAARQAGTLARRLLALASHHGPGSEA